MGLIQAKLTNNNRISNLIIFDDKFKIEKKITNLESLKNINCYTIKIDIKKIIQRFIENKIYISDTTEKSYFDYVNSNWIAQIYYLINISSLGIFFFSENTIKYIKKNFEIIKRSGYSTKINRLVPIEIIIPKVIFNYDTYDSYYKKFDKIFLRETKNLKIKINKSYRIRNIFITTAATVNPIIKFINVLTYILKILNNSISLDDSKFNIENFLKDYSYNLGYINDYRLITYKNSNIFLNNFTNGEINSLDEEFNRNKGVLQKINSGLSLKYIDLIKNTIIHKFKTTTGVVCYGILYKNYQIIHNKIDSKSDNAILIKNTYNNNFHLTINNEKYDYESPKFKISFLDYIIGGDVDIKSKLIRKQYNLEITSAADELEKNDNDDDEFSDDALQEISGNIKKNSRQNTNYVLMFFLYITIIGSIIYSLMSKDSTSKNDKK